MIVAFRHFYLPGCATVRQKCWGERAGTEADALEVGCQAIGRRIELVWDWPKN